MSNEAKSLKTEIERLNFTRDEKMLLRKYFTENKERQENAMCFLPDTDDEKLEYLRCLISTPGMFSHRSIK